MRARKMVSVALAFLFLLTTVMQADLAPAQASGPNLMTNSGFENNYSGGDCPDAWSCYEYGSMGGSYSQSAGEQYEGSLSGRQYNDNTTSGKIYKQAMAAEHKDKFQVTVWHKTSNLTAAPYVRVIFRNAANQDLQTIDFQGNGGTHGWQKITGTTLSAPAGTSSVHVNLTLWDSQGTVWWDAASLELIDSGGPSGDTFYLSPNGSNQNPGTDGSPWKTFNYATKQLQPGDTLVLKDGTYNSSTGTGYFDVSCSSSANNGTLANPITVKAKHERKAWLKSDGADTPFKLVNCKHWNIEGLRVSSGDYIGGATDVFKIAKSGDIKVKRLLAHHNNRYKNSQLVMVSESQDVLIEEAELYYFHRNGIEAYMSDGVTIRRTYANSRMHSDLSDGYDSHAISQNGGDRTYSFYYSNNGIVENSISENRSEGFGAISGLKTVTGQSSGKNVHFLGDISIFDNVTGATQSRKKSGEPQMPVENAYFKNFLMIGSKEKTFVTRAVGDLTMDNVTAYNNNQNGNSSSSLFSTNTALEGQWPSCANLGGCTIRLNNWLALENTGKVLDVDSGPNFIMSHSAFWGNDGIGENENITDNAGRVRNSQNNINPTNVMGMDTNKCIVFVPQGSLLKRNGVDNEDIGANILYRYHDGVQLSTPLWDPVTGEFPSGAVISGINDTAESASSVHKRLNVNFDGCTLPY